MKDSKGLTFLKNVALPVSNERELVKRKNLVIAKNFMASGSANEIAPTFLEKEFLYFLPVANFIFFPTPLNI